MSENPTLAPIQGRTDQGLQTVDPRVPDKVCEPCDLSTAVCCQSLAPSWPIDMVTAYTAQYPNGEGWYSNLQAEEIAMTPDVGVATTIDFGPVGEALKDIVSPELGDHIGKAISAEMGRRIRHQLTVFGEQIDRNSPDWELRKQNEGRIPDPLQRTGDMTEPQAWTPESSVSDGKLEITLKLDPEHWEKWDNIHSIADQQGRNWDEVWGIGTGEQEVAMLAVADHVESILKGNK